MKQSLIWIPVAEAGNSFVPKVPPIPFDGEEPSRLWSLLMCRDHDTPPELPFTPVHHKNAFMEDKIHDWNIRNKHLHYYSRVSSGGHWALLEYTD